ncbi:MAG: A/G-specific adenine glycosylase [Burkholderiaceae bacterium]|nr:MAG: A/G-specific adenine glycosylase [Burkholderiaceae bacterium]
MMPAPVDIATPVVRWQADHGRNHLPWQQTRDPYRVWLSEIMLQQTQVTTVLDYYPRFLARFPDVAALAAAPVDDVLALWSGLGYYSRARNLHRCAQQVMSVHGGAFPDTAEVLATLPGIGRSTAGAIAAFCFSERVPILDANVRRVLTRVLGFGDDLAVARNERLLWERAEALLPHEHLDVAMPRYTQGLMDLGAGVCTPRSPRCGACPLEALCQARREGETERYPVKTRKLSRRAESWWLLLRRDARGAIWLQRRPAPGIWAGLYCPPVFANSEALATQVAGVADARYLEPFTHVLTHRDLHLHPVLVSDAGGAGEVGDGSGWYGPAEWPGLGLPAPVRKLLEGLVRPPA